MATKEKNMNEESKSTRSQEITSALAPAYAKASTLKLSKAEIKKLTKPFADDLVEIRPSDGVLYVPHIHVENRLTQVFGPGGWSFICREPLWDEGSGEITAEYILLVRGYFIGEEFGEEKYNPLQGDKYGDKLSCIQAKALRSICGKKLACGSQLWEPAYCQKWIAKNAEQYQGEIYDGHQTQKTMLWRKKGAKSTLSESETPTPRAKKYQPTEDDKFLMLQCLSSLPKDQVLKFAIEQKIIGFAQELEAWPLDKVVAGEVAIRKLQTQIIGSFPSAKPEPKSWQETEIPFGSMKGKKLGELAKDVLAGYWEAMSTATITGQDDFKKALSDAAKFHHLTKLKQSSKK
jgi:hypothetical protein